jgi:hypothetical protein
MTAMVRIEVRGFQSIEHEVIEVDGFSALVGRSNIGKSAVVRAIKAALTGSSEDSYVRHGPLCLRLVKGSKTCKCSCTVHIVGPGLDLLWEKGDAVNRYVYNTVEHTVVGRGTPDFLAAEFSMVKLGDEKELLQVSDQFRPIFILNKSGGVVADVLSDVAKLDQINVAARAAEKDRKEASSTRKIREKDILDLRGALLRYDGLDEVLVRVGSVEDSDRKVDEASHRVDQLERFVEAAYGVARRVKSLEQVGTVVLPEVSPLLKLGADYKALAAFDVELRDKTTAVGSLVGVEGVVVPDLESFKTTGTMYQKLVQWAGKLDGLRGFFEKTQGLNEVQPPTLDGLAAARESYVRLSTWADKASGTAKALLELKEALDLASKAEDQVLEEFKALGVCPTCNRGYATDHQHSESDA